MTSVPRQTFTCVFMLGLVSTERASLTRNALTIPGIFQCAYSLSSVVPGMPLLFLGAEIFVIHRYASLLESILLLVIDVALAFLICHDAPSW